MINMMKKERSSYLKRYLLFIVPVLLIAVILSLAGCSPEETRIIIYQNGKKIKVDKESPYFSQLQKEIEDCFIYHEDALFSGVSKEDINDMKKTFAIEITYPEIREFSYLNEKYKNKNYSMKTQKFLMPLEHGTKLIPGARFPAGTTITGEGNLYHGGPTVNQNGPEIERRIRKLIAEYLRTVDPADYEIYKEKFSLRDAINNLPELLYRSREEETEKQSEIEIVIYRNGQEISVAPNTRYFQQLQKEIEDYYDSADGRKWPTFPGQPRRPFDFTEEKIKEAKQGQAIEISYPKELRFRGRRREAEVILLFLDGPGVYPRGVIHWRAVKRYINSAPVFFDSKEEIDTRISRINRIIEEYLAGLKK